MNDLAKGIAIASVMFIEVQDKSGRPYIEHCLTVMEKVRHLGDDFMTAAVLHDVIEDTEVTLQELTDEGFPEHVVDAIDALSRREGEDYQDFIERCRQNTMACIIKKADIEHNMEASRLKGLTEKDFKRLKKYALAYDYLKT